MLSTRRSASLKFPGLIDDRSSKRPRIIFREDISLRRTVYYSTRTNYKSGAFVRPSRYIAAKRRGARRCRHENTSRLSFFLSLFLPLSLFCSFLLSLCFAFPSAAVGTKIRFPRNASLVVSPVSPIMLSFSFPQLAFLYRALKAPSRRAVIKNVYCRLLVVVRRSHHDIARERGRMVLRGYYFS